MKGLGTGTFVWPASHVLAKYLEKVFPVSSLRGQSLCDIGSGAGLPAYVAAYLGARVTLTDQAPLLEFMRNNKKSCLESCPGAFESDNILIREYNWGEPLIGLEAPFDIVLVSDCILPKLYPIEALVKAVRAVMGLNSVAFVSYEHRVYPYFDPRIVSMNYYLTTLCFIFNFYHINGTISPGISSLVQSARPKSN